MTVIKSNCFIGQQQQDEDQILSQLVHLLGVHGVSADPQKNRHFRQGWRSGEGAALAVIFPQTAWQLWQALEICISNTCIIIMQAANTGLTEGSTPAGNDYDRPVVVINTLSLVGLTLLENNTQVLVQPGVTLHQLSKRLRAVKRSPHSVIGSSGLGATVVGGIANNSGGALVKRGPAYTELALFAQVDQHGQLVLVNHTDIDLGHSVQEILTNLDSGNWSQKRVLRSDKLASDRQYERRVRDIDSAEPSRYNADPRRLYEASGCAGKLAIFAVRVDTYPQPESQQTFYIGSNSEQHLMTLRRRLLKETTELPELAEYMHRDMFDVAAKYGKDAFYSILWLGTDRLPSFFRLKGKLDARLNRLTWLPNYLSDRCLQFFAKLLPQHLPKRMLAYRQKYEHHLIVTASDDAIAQTRAILSSWSKSGQGAYFECHRKEAEKTLLHRFVAAGAAMRYQLMHQTQVGELLALDIALPRNCQQWMERLPNEIAEMFTQRLYYGHFLCHVFHQDYVLKSGVSVKAAKTALLKHLDARGAKYPAEHNVGHLYQAESSLVAFYQQLDPTNSFNPGIGMLAKNKRACGCC